MKAGIRLKNIAFHDWTIAFCFCAGILLAGSDGRYFPLPNVIGLIIFSWVAIAANIKSGDGFQNGRHD